MTEIAATPPLTKLSEEEGCSAIPCATSPSREVRPRVAAMEAGVRRGSALLAKCFELGLMGIDVPESTAARAGAC